MNGDSRFYGDNLDSICGSDSSEDRASTDGGYSDNGGTRFYGDNMDSILGSESSGERLLTGTNWDDEHMSRPSTPPTDISLPNTPDTVGEYPNVIRASLPEVPKLIQGTAPHHDKQGTRPQPYVVNGTHHISFQLGNFPSDAELDNLYPQEIERRFAFMARDMVIVANHHIMAITGAGGMKLPLTLSSSGVPFLQRESLTDTMAALISRLSSLKDLATTTLVCNGGELQGTPQPKTTPWLHWPLNRHCVYLCKLLSTYTGMTTGVRYEQAEIADYCIANHHMMDPREVLFHDGCKVQLERCQFVSMEQGEVCSPAIVTAWCRILKGRRNGCGKPIVAYLDVVDKVDPVHGDDDEVVDHWVDWLETSQIDIHNAELVFIPVRMRNHYSLLAINFNDNTIQSIDGVSHSDQPAWDLMVKIVCGQFQKLLETFKHKYSADFLMFSYQLVNPKWSSHDESPDSAIEVMHLMDSYDGNQTSIGSMLLNEDNVRDELKISYAADIVVSKVSVCRDSVLAKLPGFIQDKCNDVLRPTRDVVQYRQVYGWLANV